MSNIQSQDLFAIAGVSNIDEESAAAVSGGNLDLSDLRNGGGRRLNNLKGRFSSLGGFNNKASWYQLKGNRDWFVYTGKNFTGLRFRIKAGTKGNFAGLANNNIESARPV
ncbi:hypothetical protein [Calothrix sp. 336/3]|uniref:hypothetical protein n=1 Tax=Calothrix sp. 336/3 TaxID=1337936 RepID=UPI0004E36F26|nr:hypothetical protein [Calothrix sp. 336/3]AKG22634.1 hypothetical protein IJ00_16355 [Calothrix sp. 336/3]